MEVFQHILRIDHQVFDQARQTPQGKIEGDGGVGGNIAFNRRMGDIPFVPQSDIFQRRQALGTNITRLTGEIFRQNRVALVGHGARTLLAFTEKFFDFENFGALQMSNLHRNTLHGRRNNCQHTEEFGMTVTGNHLG